MFAIDMQSAKLLLLEHGITMSVCNWFLASVDEPLMSRGFKVARIIMLAEICQNVNRTKCHEYLEKKRQGDKTSCLFISRYLRHLSYSLIMYASILM